MTLSPNIKDREFAKFGLNSSSEVAVRTLTELVGDVLAKFSGLSTRLKVTNETVGDTAVTLPVSGLTARNSIIILNKSTTETLYIGESDVTASGVKEGWEVDPGSFFSTDITDSIMIYGIAPSGQSIPVKIMELA